MNMAIKGGISLPGLRAAGATGLCCLLLSGCLGENDRIASSGSGAPAATAGPVEPAVPTVRTMASMQIASAAGKYLAGRHARQHRDFGAAAEHFSGALQLESENRKIRREAFRSMIAGGRMEEAAALARQIVKDNEGAAIPNLSIVIEDALAGKLAEAEARLKTVPRRGMNTFAVPLLLAWFQAGQEKFDDAIKSLEPLEKVASFSALSHLHLGLIRELSGNTAAAEGNLAKAAEASRSLRVIQAYGGFLERNGRGPEAKLLYENFERENAGTVAFQSALARLDRGEKPGPFLRSYRDGLAEVFFNLAGTLAQGRTSELGLIYGRLALRLRPDFPLAQVLLAGLLEALDRGQDAVALYRAVSPDSHLYQSAQLRLASLLDDLKRTDEAIALLRLLSEKDRQWHEPLVRLGDLLRSEKKFEEASNIYSAAMKRIGDLSENHWSLFYARGISYERSDRWPLAEKDFLKALELSPDQPFVLNYLGYSWVDKGMHLDRARKMIETAVSKRPNDGYIVDSLGWVHYRLGNYKDAVEQLERAVVLRPEDPVINDHLGDAYWRVGRLLEARFQWKRALSLDPEKDQIPLIQKKLNQGLAAASKKDRRG